MLYNKYKLINLVSVSFISIFFILILILIIFPNLGSKYFKVEKVIIEGTVKSNKIQIKESIFEFQQNLIHPKFTNIQEIVESNDWVKRASIRKIFPSTLFINVVENDPSAIYFEEGKTYLLDIDGSIIIEINLDIYKNDLPFVRGENATTYLEQIIKNINIIFPDLTAKIKELEYIENRRWNVRLENNLLIKLPDENIEKSLKNLKDLFDNQQIMKSNIIEIDLRVQGRAAIKVLDGKVNYGIDEI